MTLRADNLGNSTGGSMGPTAGLIVGGIVGAVLVAVTVTAINMAMPAGRIAAIAPVETAAVDHSQHVLPATAPVEAHLEDLVMARQLLMDGAETAMMPIDRTAAGQDVDLVTLKANAYSIYIGLSVAPHLFPPSTKPAPTADGSTPSTAAAPGIWDDFEAFYQQMIDAANLAYRASQAADVASFRQLGAELRVQCDGCHARHMQVYDPTKAP